MKTQCFSPIILALLWAPTHAAMPMPQASPHYFGPYPNYANSPLRIPAVLVTLSGGNGSGATAEATVDPATGALTDIAVVTPGSGYTTVPQVSITGAGTLATATAEIDDGGAVTAIHITHAGSGYVTPGIKKFIDTLPGLTPAGANGLGQYLPVAVPDTNTYPGSDYYEIAVVQYRMKMHSDLPATLLRGYVQLSTGVVPGDHVALSNANLTGSNTPINGYFGVDRPHYLGPMIMATRNRPVRILFRNLLPIGVAGDLFVPVDVTVMGSGMGPLAPQTPSVDLGLVTDEVRNPPGSMGYMPGMPEHCYTQNRATLHLHGGRTPWISDGTPHQWITPSNEITSYSKGVSVQNVPDMPDPGPGAQTFFYTNQQSARLMFYHDHSWGITRLNVYAGEAAPYLISDSTEAALTAPGGALEGLGYGLPLVIQDKTFVPGPDQLAMEDPTWNSTRWGGMGNLWVSHVMMPAQNPGDSTGSNQFGRWHYGPWFWPPATPKYGPIANPYYDPNADPEAMAAAGLFYEPPLIPGVPNISTGMESFNDTPVVNGTAYPTVTLEPKPYRLRILNAANDRFWNLQWYVADSSGTEVALNAQDLEDAQTDPDIVPQPDLDLSPAGPDWIQIGNEGGFLPTPVVISGHQPTTWITNPTRFDVGNVDKHSLLLGCAERADVVVDFSQFAGKTLILYNDAPAAFPARIPSYDYYTGGPDMIDAGGVPPIPPGYGPNTRTIMQVKIAGTASQPFNLTRLNAAFAHHLDANGKPAGVFEASQDPIVVGQGAYNTAYGSTFRSTGPARDGFARIFDMSLTFNTLLTGNSTSNTLTIPFENKGIHDETNAAVFDDYGRMSANLGLEAPGATPLTQNIILYPYINPVTEFLQGIELPVGKLEVTPVSTTADGTQIWKLTHNGVDTHPIHFHLFDVQVLNRVTWDNIIIPPDPNELGWKETVRVSPLEDTIVAFRPIMPKQPFGVPDSIRPLNPAMPLGDTSGFNNTDTVGNPINPVITNQLANFGWEYVWHCHILGHEEMDMMRPMKANASRALPDAPFLSILGNTNTRVDLSWIDGTAVTTDLLTWGDPKAEIGYRIQRASFDSRGRLGAYSTIGSALANATRFTDNSAGLNTIYQYRIFAFNAAGNSPVSNEVLVNTAITGTITPAAPTNLTATAQTGARASLTFRDNASNETGFWIDRSTNGGSFVPLTTLPSKSGTGNVGYIDLSVVAGNSYVYRVAAMIGANRSSYSNTAAVNFSLPAPPSNLTVTAVRKGNRDTVTLRWRDNSNNETGFTILRATNATFTQGLVSQTVRANTVALAQSNRPRRSTYYYRISAINNYGASMPLNATPFPIITP
jgi:FtsP/CotA-like multicopper oxidase with cupredoxin domain